MYPHEKHVMLSLVIFMKRTAMTVLLLISCGCLALVSGFLFFRASVLSGRLPDTLNLFQNQPGLSSDEELAEDTSSQIPLDAAAYPGVVALNQTDPTALYSLYDFLYIGDSFIQRLADSGILHESSTVLAKSGSSPKDWYIEEDNERYVDFLSRLQAMEGTPFRGILINYGINNIKSDKNIPYMEQLIEDIRAVFPDVPLFVMKLMPVAEQFVIIRKEQIAWTSEQVNHGEKNCVDAFNEELERFCRTQKNTRFIDATADFIDEQGNLKTEYADERGLHIAEPYIEAWCRNIFQAVTAH